MPLEKLLAVETVTQYCSVALDLDGIQESRTITEPNAHSDVVLDLIDELLNEAGVELAKLDGLVVDAGPGSFTGIRIGMGVAQGLAYGSGLGVYAANSLESMASRWVNRPVAAALDARMDQIYAGIFEFKDDEVLIHESIQVGGPEHILDQWSSRWGAKSLLPVGNGWELAGKGDITLFCDNDNLHDSANNRPLAEDLIRLARIRGVGAMASPLEIDASYIRNRVTS